MRWTGPAVAGLLCVLPAALPAMGQYAGKVGKTDKDAPELRSIAVLEWTGDEGKPKASRLVPVAVLDGGELQDGGVYLARPEPLALAPTVEYQLEEDGKPLGLYDIKTAGQQLGSWVGFGAWRPIPSEHPKLTAAELAKTRLDDADEPGSDQPVLHRKRHADESSPSSGKASSDSSAAAAPDDPDRPVLHKKAAGSGDSSASSSTTASTDPDRPTLHKSKKAEPKPDGDDAEQATTTDPDRPRLKRGKSSGSAVEVVPSLLGLPEDLNQTVAVSDAQNHPAHPWMFTWENPEDRQKMKESLEATARTALGLDTKPAPKPKRAAAGTAATRKAAKPAPPAEPAKLVDEEFRVFELAYGSGATLVLSAHTGGPVAQQKFVTLIAQPDLYGNVQVLLNSVTDSKHLDVKPRMRLVDAVDALADNRGELLFELRGATERQFALYRVLRGQAEQLFVSGTGQFAMASKE